MYWLPYAGSGSATLNLTLANGTTTGAKNCYYSGANRLTTHYAAGNAIHLTYRINANVNGTNYTGWWADANYDSNTYDRIRFNNSVTAKSAITSGRLIAGDDSGFYHLKAGVAFDVNKPILYAVSAITAAATGTNNYLSYPSINLRTTIGNTSWTATRGKTVYLAGVLEGTSFTPIAANWITTDPEDSLTVTYIALGYMYSAYQIYLYPEHPMYRMLNSALTAVSQLAYEAQATASSAQAAATAVDTNFKRVVRIDDDGLHIGDNLSNGEVLVDSESVNVVLGGKKYSKFAGSYVQFGNYQLRRSSDGGLVFKLA